MKDNIQRKCSQLGTESSNYIEETFGKKIEDVKVKFLIDCSFKEEFETKFQSLCNTWCDKGFVTYMESFKKSIMPRLLLVTSEVILIMLIILIDDEPFLVEAEEYVH